MNTFALLAIGLIAAAPIDESGSWNLAPNHLVGQEIVYNGSVTEVSTAADGARFEQPYELEASMLVMNVAASGEAEIGCYTVLRLPDYRDQARKRENLESVTSSHFALVNVTPTGAATWSQNEVGIALPPSGRVAWELGYIVEVPNKLLKPGAAWLLRRAGQQPTQCRVAGVEPVLGIRCVKLETIQSSQNWDAENVTQSAWLNRSTVWIDPRTQIVRRVHRDYRVREAGDTEPTRAVLTQFDLSSDNRYHGELLQQRIADFRAGHSAQSQLERALSAIDRQRPRLLAAVQDSIELLMRDKLYWTPYRPAILEMSSLAEYASKAAGEADGARRRPDAPSLVGKRARSFVIRDLANNETLTLRKVKGKAVILVFMDPSSLLSQRALRTAVWAVQNHAEIGPQLYAVCTEADEEAVKQLKEAVPGKYTVCTGKGIDRAYGVDALPHTLLIDADGYLRGSYTGLGPELPVALVTDLRDTARRVENISRNKAPSFLR